MSKKMKLMVLTAALTLGAAMTSYAGWKQNDTGYWWQNDDGSYPTSSWHWLDGNGDGIPSAIILTGTVTWRPIPPPRTATRWMEAEPGW